MLSDGNQTDGHSLERILTPYQNSRLASILEQNIFVVFNYDNSEKMGSFFMGHPVYM